MNHFIEQAHPEWHRILSNALEKVDRLYLSELLKETDWFPGGEHLFAAFTVPLSQTRYILLGESPYPRKQSANGFAFWDASVERLWCETGLSKPVNRATSLRNFLKMLLVARGNLQNDFSQAAISQIDKSGLVGTLDELFQGLLREGFLLLNASLVFSQGRVNYHAKHWRPFMVQLLKQLAARDVQTIQLILFGKISQAIPDTTLKPALLCEHPYNLSFIINPNVLKFFKPFNLLEKYDDSNLN